MQFLSGLHRLERPWLKITGIVVASIFFAASAVLYVYYISRLTLINELTYAASVGDMNAFNKRTDWETLRTTLKSDLRNRANSLIGQTSGHAMPDDAIDALVDYYVIPANIPALFYYKNRYKPDAKPEDFIRGIEFNGLSEFIVDLGLPPQKDKPWLNYAEPVRLVFSLEGTQWRIKQIVTPLYAIPKDSPTSLKIKKSEDHSNNN